MNKTTLQWELTPLPLIERHINGVRVILRYPKELEEVIDIPVERSDDPIVMSGFQIVHYRWWDHPDIIKFFNAKAV